MLMRSSSLLACLVILVACAPRPDTSQLDADIQAACKRIENAQTERGRYNAGSLIHAVVSLRLATEQQTLGMLEQRRSALLYFIRTSYQVNGAAYQPPADAPARIANLQAELAAAQQEASLARSAAGE